jgi:hypothetical protein
VSGVQRQRGVPPVGCARRREGVTGDADNEPREPLSEPRPDFCVADDCRSGDVIPYGPVGSWICMTCQCVMVAAPAGYVPAWKVEE